MAHKKVIVLLVEDHFFSLKIRDLSTWPHTSDTAAEGSRTSFRKWDLSEGLSALCFTLSAFLYTLKRTALFSHTALPT